MSSSWQQIQESANRAFCGGLFDAALNHYLQALEAAKSAGDLCYKSDSWRGLAKTYLQLGKTQEALQAAQEADAADREFWGYENQQVSEDMFLMAEAWRRQEEFSQARQLFERVLDLRLIFSGEMHDDTLEVLIRLIWVELQDGQDESLVILTRRAVDTFAALHPAGAFTRALNIKFLLQPYIEQNRQHEAELVSSRIQQTLRTVLGGAHPEIRQLLADCSMVKKSANKPMAAWQLQSRADLIQKKELTDLRPEPPAVPNIVVDGIPVFVHQSNPELAKEKAKQMSAVDSQIDLTRQNQSVPWQQLCDQGQKALAGGLYDSALSFFLAALDAARKVNDQPSVSAALRQLTSIYLEIGMFEKAEQSASEAAKIDRAFWGNENPYVSEDDFLLAEALRRQRKFAAARELLERVIMLRIKLHGEADRETLIALIHLIWLDLQEDHDSLLEHTQYFALLYNNYHPESRMAEWLDMKSLLQPYFERNVRKDIEFICEKMQSAARTAFGEGNKDTALFEAECAEMLRVPERIGPPVKPKVPTASVRTPHAEAIASLYSPADSFVDSPESMLDRRSNASAIASSQRKKNEQVEPNSNLNLGTTLLNRALGMAGLDLELGSFIKISVGVSIAVGICSAVTYCAAGYFLLSLEAFAVVVLAMPALIASVLFVLAMLRQSTLARQLPDSLEIIVSLLQAGTPISEAFIEISTTSPMPIRTEYKRVVSAIKDGKSLSQALTEMMSYMNAPQLAQLKDAINANLSSGGNLARQVSIIAKELREEEKARLLLQKSLGSLTVVAVIVGLGSLGFIVNLAFNPAVGALLLDSAGAKFLLLLVFGFPLVLMFVSKKFPGFDKSLRHLPDSKIGSFIDKWLMKERLRNELSKFLDLVVIYVKSGISFPAAVQKVRDEASSSCPTLARELQNRLQENTSYNSSLPLAFKSIGDQYEVRELLTLAATLEATSRLGGSISNQLIEQSESLRNQIAHARKARAASAYSVAMLIGFTLFALFWMLSKLF